MKIVCVYHSIDLDGWMSAAIVKHWFLTKSPESHMTGIDLENYPNKISNLESARNWNVLDFCGYNYGQPIPDLSEYDKVIMCDISFPKEIMWEIKNKLTWIDHHISAIKENQELLGTKINGITYIHKAACELTWEYFFPNETMPEIVRLLGRYDCFGHKNTSEERTVLEFQYGARQCISNYEEAYHYLNQTLTIPDIRDRQNVVKTIHNQGKSIYQYLCTEAKQTYKNGFEINFNQTNYHPHDGVKKFICINKERFNPVNFGIDYHKDGYEGAACFHYDGKLWSFSLYNDNGLVDCSTIAKQLGGGGHKGAAGFKIDNINKIIKYE